MKNGNNETEALTVTNYETDTYRVSKILFEIVFHS